jgi:predicted nuclease of predicted toxin-antitoxin system
MRLLIDNSVSWRVARDLTKPENGGHDAIHVAQRGLASAPDPLIYRHAAEEKRIIITQDSDFGPIHASDPQPGVGVVLLRMSDGRPSHQAQVLADNLPTLQSMLIAGAVVIIEDEFIRVQQEGAGS